MDYRLTEVFPEKTYSADYTEIIDFNLAEMVSAIMIEYAVYSSAAGSMDGHPAELINKVELVDGSDVLLSLSGKQLEAIDFYETGMVRNPWNAALSGNYLDRRLCIPFGRYVGDTLLALDPSKFRNLQLKIKVDIGAGCITNTSGKVNVHAWVFDDMTITPLGFLMHKEIKSWTLSASAHEYTDLPLDYNIRRLFLQQQEEGTEPNQNIENIKLSEDNDKKIVFDAHSDTFTSFLRGNCPIYAEHWYFVVANSNRYLMCTPTSKVAAQIVEWSTAVKDADFTLYDGDGGRLKTLTDYAGSVNSQIFVQGYNPHGVFHLPCFAIDEPGHYYAVNRINKVLRADIQAASGVAGTETANIFLQQFRNY